MSKAQKPTKKDFSLEQYYNQLQKYQVVAKNSKSKFLNRDLSAGTIIRESSKNDYSKYSKDHKQHDSHKLDLSKYTKKNVFQKVNRFNSQNYRGNQPYDDRNSSYFTDSLGNSHLTGEKNMNDSNIEEKQNFNFTEKNQRQFVEHCTDIYDLKPSEKTLENIIKEIDKRDQVYQVVKNHLGVENEQGYAEKVKKHFQQYRIMKKVIEEFKAISKLQIQELNELYYFLKEDR